MSVTWLWLMMWLAALAAWVAATWIRARYGYPSSSIDSKIFAPQRARARPSVPPAAGERDARIARLEDRVRVLERIVTDREAELRRELERL